MSQHGIEERKLREEMADGGSASQTTVVRSAIDWMKDHLDEIRYGEVSLVFTVQDGKIQYVDKLFRKKERVD